MHTTIHRFLRRITFAFCFYLFTININAQWVSIPDDNFGEWLNINGYAQCLQGSSSIGWKLDTTCNDVLTVTGLDVQSSNISNLDGIKYFKALTVLNCQFNNLVTLPALPATLSILNCRSNQLTTVSNLPSGLGLIDISYNPTLTSVTLNNSLDQLICNNIGSAINGLISNLPPFLSKIQADENNIPTLPQLHDNVIYMSFNNCNINNVLCYQK